MISLDTIKTNKHPYSTQCGFLAVEPSFRVISLSFTYLLTYVLTHSLTYNGYGLIRIHLHHLLTYAFTYLLICFKRIKRFIVIYIILNPVNIEQTAVHFLSHSFTLQVNYTGKYLVNKFVHPDTTRSCGEEVVDM